MVRHNIEAILIIDRNGMPRFFMQLDPRSAVMDPILASSFFAAIDMFSKEVFDTRVPVFHIDYGARLFTVIQGVTTNLLAVSYGELHEEVVSILNSLLAEFELDWLSQADPHDLDSSFIEIYLQAFGERIMQKLSFQELPPQWTPYFLPGIRLSESSKSPISRLIDGVKTIEQIMEEGDISEKAMLLEMSRLWAFRAIRFKNMVDYTDYISTRNVYGEYLQSTSEKRDSLKRQYTQLVPIVDRLAGYIDGRRSVEEILEYLNDYFTDKDIYKTLDYLVDKDAIEVLGPEKRRVLLAKEALEIMLRASDKVYSNVETQENLFEIMNEIDSPETIGQLKYFAERWTVDFDFKIYENLPPRRLMLIYGEWIKLLAMFVDKVNKDKIERLTRLIVQAYENYLFKRYHNVDLRGFEEFSYWLEFLHSDQSAEISLSMIGNTKGHSKSPLAAIAHSILTRGQTIYGTKQIKQLCQSCNINLVDELSLSFLEEYDDEELWELLILYASNNAASKLTTIILLKQRNLEVPDRIHKAN